MIPLFKIFLLLAFITLGACSKLSSKGDQCSKLDRCNSKSVLKTCSCDDDCHVFGTCCHDNHKVDLPALNCYSRRTANPMFAKRSCPEGFRGHVGDVRGCLEDDEDERDVRNNLLVTSRTTKVTYWNKRCAKCNNELDSDLEFWDIVVHCPSRQEIDSYLIRRNLTFDEDKLQWGLVIGDEFLRCFVKYSPPPYADKVKRCRPNVIANCSTDYDDEAVATKCSQYYAERKLKNSDSYFKNLHCALCNGVDAEQLECPGMSSPEDDAEEGDFRDMVEEFFTNGDWFENAPGREIRCSRGFSYDPFREKCRNYEIQETVTTAMINSAHGLGRASLATLVPFVTVLIKMIIFESTFAYQQSV